MKYKIEIIGNGSFEETSILINGENVYRCVKAEMVIEESKQYLTLTFDLGLLPKYWNSGESEDTSSNLHSIKFNIVGETDDNIPLSIFEEDKE